MLFIINLKKNLKGKEISKCLKSGWSSVLACEVPLLHSVTF